MTDQRDLDRLLGAFFVEGTNEVADRVIDAALIEIDQTQQRRVGRMPRRLMTMKRPMRVAAAAVIGVIAVGGTLYAVNPWQSAVAPSSTPDSSAGPSASPSLSVVPASGPSWTTTGRMVVPRSGSATLLPDGTVLVAGGGTAGRETEAELYDPVSDTWSETRRMGQGNDDAIAVLLPDGTVLVGSADLYEPRTKSWTRAAEAMPRGPDGGRFGDIEAMIALRDGRVLALGSHGQNALYDPGRHAWSLTGTMVTPRFHSTVALLADGRVLAVGGIVPLPDEPEHRVASAELYDPGTGSWTATGDMVEPRSSITATVLPDARVLVTGNVSGPRDPVRSSAELYDPGTGTWTATRSMITPRIAQTATLLTDGRVLMAGGRGTERDALTSAELYDPVNGSWSATASMVRPHDNHRAVLLADGRVLVVDHNAELYDPGDR